jgi:O-antigen/teichoic acid export membrane protein
MPLQRIKHFAKSDVFKSFTVLFSGTLVAQAIGYAIAPILTRLYSTAEMGEMLYYMRLVSFIASMATLRYEAALPLPKREEHSFLLYRFIYFLAFWILVFTTCVIVVLTWIFNLTDFEPWFIGCVIAGTASMIIINVGTSWAVRTGSYGLISRQKIINSLVSNVLKWGFFFLAWSSFGLILATMLGFVISAAEFVWDYRRTHRTLRPLFSTKKTRVLLRAHKKFPLWNLPHVLLDNGRDMFLATLILASFSVSVYGAYGHAYQMLRIPLMLIGISIGQLFYNRSSEAMHQNKPLLPILSKTVFTLTIISIVPFTVLFFFGAEIFALVFGERWAVSGTYAETMSFWLMVNFVLSPITALPLLLNRQKEALIVGFISALLQIVPLWILPQWYGSSEDTFVFCLQVVSYSQAFWLIFVVYLYFHYTRVEDRKILG